MIKRNAEPYAVGNTASQTPEYTAGGNVPSQAAESAAPGDVPSQTTEHTAIGNITSQAAEPSAAPGDISSQITEKPAAGDVPFHMLAAAQKQKKPSVNMNQIVGSQDILLICLDTLRYDAAIQEESAGTTPVLNQYGPWEKRQAPGNFTWPSHHSILSLFSFFFVPLGFIVAFSLFLLSHFFHFLFFILILLCFYRFCFT